MGFFIDREESDKEAVIRYKKLPFYYIGLGGMVVYLLYCVVTQNYSFFLIPVIAMFLLSIPFWKTNAEIKKALRKGNVKMTGSKYSFKNPLQVVIQKEVDEK